MSGTPEEVERATREAEERERAEEERRRAEEERKREERARQCEAAQRDRDAAANQIDVLSSHISEQRSIAASAEEKMGRLDEWLRGAADTQGTARSRVEDAVRDRDRARDEIGNLRPALAQAEADLEKAQKDPGLIGWESHVSGPDKVRELTSALTAAEGRLTAAESSMKSNREVVDTQKSQISAWQADLSDASSTATSARAKASAAEDEKSRREGERREAQSRVDNYCG